MDTDPAYKKTNKRFRQRRRSFIYILFLWYLFLLMREILFILKSE